MEWRLDFYVSVPPSGTAQCLMLQYLFCLRGCCHSGAPPVIIPKGVGSSPSSPTCPVFLDTRPAAIQALLVGARRKLILPIQFKDDVLIFFLIMYLELNAAGTLTSLWIGLIQPGKRSFPCKPQKGTYMQDSRVALSIFFSLRGQAISLTWEEQDFFSNHVLQRQHWSSKRYGVFENCEPSLLLNSSKWTISSCLFSFHWNPIP